MNHTLSPRVFTLPRPGAGLYRLKTRSNSHICRSAQQQVEQAPAELEELKLELAKAVKDEDYSTAAKLRDMIKSLEDEDPLKSLELELTKAINEERYEDAASIRDKLKELAPPPLPLPDVGNTATTSDTITEGIRVKVQSFYVPDNSNPQRNAYYFAYKISIKNESNPRTVKLKSRHWIIEDGSGTTREVRGPGVVGEEPELPPGGSFEYTSACPLTTPTGTMVGSFEFYARKKPSDPNWSLSFLVNVGKFGLTTEGPRAA